MVFRTSRHLLIIILISLLFVTGSTQLFSVELKTAKGVVTSAHEISRGTFMNGALVPDAVTVVIKLDAAPETSFVFSSKDSKLDKAIGAAYRAKKPITLQYITENGSNIVKKVLSK